MAEMVDNPMGAAAQAASEVRDDLRSIQQDIPADDLAKLYDALEMWESHGDLRGDRASLQGNLAREVHTLKSDIGAFKEGGGTESIRKISASSDQISTMVARLQITNCVVDVTTSLELANGDERIIELTRQGVDLINASVVSGDYNNEHVRLFLLKLTGIFSRLKQPSLVVIEQILTKGLFMDSVDSFVIYSFLMITVSEMDTRSVDMFTSVISNRGLRIKMAVYDLLCMRELIVGFFEDKYPRYDKALSHALCGFVRQTFSGSRLRQLLRGVKFSLSKEDIHLQPLYTAFVVHGTLEVKMHFLKVLVDNKQLHHFGKFTVTTGISPSLILGAIGQLCAPQEKYCFSTPVHPGFKAGNYASKDCPLSKEHYALNNTIFVKHTMEHIGRVRAELQPLFVRLVYYASYRESPAEQENMGLNEHMKSIVELMNKLGCLSLMNLNTFFFKQLFLALPSLKEINFTESCYRLRTSLQHTSSVNVERVNELAEITHSVGKIKNGTTAVQDLFKSLFGRPGEETDILKWQSSSLNDRLFYTYCYVKYPLVSFKKWTDELNLSKEYADGITTQPEFYERFEEPLLSKKLHGIDSLHTYGYNFVQNSQLLAVYSALDCTRKGMHFFGKLGTGQGKSLVFAILALQYVKAGEKVVIFSCYDHLSKRDHANFQQFFADHNISSAHLSEGSKSELESQVLYADMDTFSQKYYENVRSVALGERDYIFPLNDFSVCLLDEFDALLIDGDSIGNWVYNAYGKLYTFPTYSDVGTARKEFLPALMKEPNYSGMFQKMQSDGNANLLQSWVGQFSSSQGRTEVDKMGHKVTYVGGEWDELSKGKFNVFYGRLDIVSYLCGMNKVVGFSGSISRESMGRFKGLLKKTDKEGNESTSFKYLEIPPFYGLRSGKNIVRAKEENCSNWIGTVRKDLDAALAKSPPVPVLVFADVNNSSDWTAVKNLVNDCCTKRKRTSQTIDDEKQVGELTLSKAADPAYITLATHIVGRGADFKVLPDVNRAGGLHVLITGVPNADARLLTQMIGRTARMDNDGSHSIILRGSLPSEDMSPIQPAEFKRDFSRTSHMVSVELAELTYDKPNWEKWIMLLTCLKKLDGWPQGFHTLKNEERAARLLHWCTNESRSYFTEKVQTRYAKKPEKSKGGGFCVIM